ncbi:14818_t:CDS:2, partial [Gigaspora rosea]
LPTVSCSAFRLPTVSFSALRLPTVSCSALQLLLGEETLFFRVYDDNLNSAFKAYMYKSET